MSTRKTTNTRKTRKRKRSLVVKNIKKIQEKDQMGLTLPLLLPPAVVRLLHLLRPLLHPVEVMYEEVSSQENVSK